MTDDDGEREREAPNKPSKSVEKPHAGTRLSAAEIHDNVRGPAEEELKRSTFALLCSSFAAGLVIGFSFLAGGFVQTLVPPRYADAAAGAVYPLGFVFVIFARSELFTENTLEPVIPLLHRRDAATFVEMMRLWSLLLVGNLAGAALFAFAMQRTAILDGDVKTQLEHLATVATSDGFGLTFARAIMAGWLIALLTWLLASTQESIAHLVLIWLATAPIALLSFRHSIAGSVEAFYRVASGSASLAGMGGSFVLPAVLGNAVGGVVLVALLNYGQVHHERTEAA
jgi:formate/nitrite transporter FocA (FNT family)